MNHTQKQKHAMYAGPFVQRLSLECPLGENVRTTLDFLEQYQVFIRDVQSGEIELDEELRRTLWVGTDNYSPQNRELERFEDANLLIARLEQWQTMLAEQSGLHIIRGRDQNGQTITYKPVDPKQKIEQAVEQFNLEYSDKGFQHAISFFLEKCGWRVSQEWMVNYFECDRLAQFFKPNGKKWDINNLVFSEWITRGRVDIRAYHPKTKQTVYIEIDKDTPYERSMDKFRAIAINKKHYGATNLILMCKLGAVYDCTPMLALSNEALKDNALDTRGLLIMADKIGLFEQQSKYWEAFYERQYND